MLSQGQRLTVTDNFCVFGQILSEEIVHHSKSFGVGNQGGFGINTQELFDIGRVIRFHMLNDQIIGFSCTKAMRDIVQPLMRKTAIHRVQNGNFLIHQDVGIIRHSARYLVLPFKQVDFMIVDTNIVNIHR